MKLISTINPMANLVHGCITTQFVLWEEDIIEYGFDPLLVSAIFTHPDDLEGHLSDYIHNNINWKDAFEYASQKVLDELPRPHLP
jgi:nitrogenase molybdenum-iron protein alpha/beta subunit